jgi:hypothetical protein
MGTKVQNEAAARARAARLAQIAHQNSPDTHEEESDYCPINVDSDSDDDCGYTGGVNVADLESDDEPDFDSSESEWSDDDGESLVEMEGDELAANLRALKAKADTFDEPPCNQKLTAYYEISKSKTSKTWKKAEANRALGYTGTSTRLRQLRDKEARDGAAVRQQARES